MSKSKAPKQEKLPGMPVDGPLTQMTDYFIDAAKELSNAQKVMDDMTPPILKEMKRISKLRLTRTVDGVAYTWRIQTGQEKLAFTRKDEKKLKNQAAA